MSALHDASVHLNKFYVIHPLNFPFLMEVSERHFFDFIVSAFHVLITILSYILSYPYRSFVHIN